MSEKKKFKIKRKKKKGENNDGKSNRIITKKGKDDKGRKVFRGKIKNNISEEIMNNEQLNSVIEVTLPSNYNFEIHKTLDRIQKINAKMVALQFPEGLLMYGGIISDILRDFGNVDTILLGDVTYGACCVDDFTASALNADLLVHYGHSCLVPINITTIPVLYVFVEIKFDTEHLVDTLLLQFGNSSELKQLEYNNGDGNDNIRTEEEEEEEKDGTKLKNKEKLTIALMGTIQFTSSLHHVVKQLKKKQLKQLEEDQKITTIELIIPQVKPLSKGEVLGCTSPKIDNSEIDALVYVADGRFHLESIMIHNPDLLAYKYDPYNKQFTIEKYQHQEMKSIRLKAIKTASKAKNVGLIIGTLGRQGSGNVVGHLENLLKERDINYCTILLSEIFPSKLQLFNGIDAFIQIACPRLSIDWGYAFDKPLLSPYEAEVAFSYENMSIWCPNDVYPMDFYSKSAGKWGVYYDHQNDNEKNNNNNNKKCKKNSCDC